MRTGLGGGDNIGDRTARCINSPGRPSCTGIDPRGAGAVAPFRAAAEDTFDYRCGTAMWMRLTLRRTLTRTRMVTPGCDGGGCVRGKSSISDGVDFGGTGVILRPRGHI